MEVLTHGLQKKKKKKKNARKSYKVALDTSQNLSRQLL